MMHAPYGPTRQAEHLDTNRDCPRSTPWGMMAPSDNGRRVPVCCRRGTSRISVSMLIGVLAPRASFSLQYRYLNMAKEQTDRTTLDLFADERRPGRPKTSPLSREEQLRINKRNQLQRDRVNGLRRVELKMNEEAVDILNRLAQERDISRSELIEQMLLTQLPLDT